MALMELTKENFEATFAGSETLIIDFWASWCGPCKFFAPTFESTAQDHPEITFAKCNTEEQPELAAAFGIRSIPTLAIFREQIMLFKQAGALPKPAFQDLVGQVKGLDMEKVKADVEAQRAADAKAASPADQAAANTAPATDTTTSSS